MELIDAHPKRLDEGHVGSTDSISQGHYLSHLAGCRACHGEDLRGGDESIGADLVDGSFSRWGFQDFTKAMRQGIRPDSQAMPEEMPWPEFGRLTDEELKQLFDYLKSLRLTG